VTPHKSCDQIEQIDESQIRKINTKTIREIEGSVMDKPGSAKLRRN
jgi:hypothetical protein